MVCIAAFIILCLIGLFVAILSIFKREIGRKYWKTFKKAWGCVWKKVRLQKCETNFKDDVKNSILKKVVIKRPKLVKPLSALIEVFSVLIVFVTIWSLVEAAKAGLSLWALGTCNVTSPSSCALGADACSTEEKELNWFEEWGEIFGAIPDRVKNWNVEDYTVEPKVYAKTFQDEKPLALDIVDPGCSACMGSYRNQLESGFFDKYNTVLLVYPIETGEGYKFENSGVIARYFYASALVNSDISAKILEDKPNNFMIRGDFIRAVCDAFPDLKNIEHKKNTRIPFKITRNKNAEYAEILGRLGILDVYSGEKEFHYGRPLTKGEAADIIARACIAAAEI